MPPQAPQTPILPQAPKKESAGPIVGAIIVVVLLIVGGLYFWGARLNHQDTPEQLPFITGDVSTTTMQ
ncbi:MAG: hypothetical protein Q8R25_01120 [bacterium]|nr:hypothetical protein [bacterium]